MNMRGKPVLWMFISGTGLGLSIVKHSAEFHNAKVKLISKPGKGTSITVTFKAAGKPE